MKKALSLLLALLLSVPLCGCGRDDAPAPEPGTALDLFYQAILDAQPEDAEELLLFEESDPDLIDSLYPGLDRIALNQQAIYLPPIVSEPCEIAMVEVKNEADVQAVIDVFQNRINKASDNITYPGTSAGWVLFAQLQKRGNYVCLIVLPDGYDIPRNVFGL